MWIRNLFVVAMFFLVVGAINLGVLGFLRINMFEILFGKSTYVHYIIYGLILMSALFVAFSRDFYLPFLGETVIPCSVLEERTPDHADTDVVIHSLQPGTKILYWAAESGTERLGEIKDWRKAYLDFTNAGVTTADHTGTAILRLRKPQPYTVPMKRTPLQEHVHWRACGEDGFLGPVQTSTISSK